MKINPPGGRRTLSKISVEPGAAGKRFFFAFDFLIKTLFMAYKKVSYSAYQTPSAYVSVGR
jgi:hypothetical protein